MKINISDVALDDEFYPRSKHSWYLANKYASMMTAGAEFPAIVVAEYRKKKYLVDGRHRLEASKQNGKKKIEAEVLKGLNKREIFIEAVRRNVGHGQSLSAHDVRNSIVRMKELGISVTSISDIVCMSIDKVDKFVAKGLTSSITGKEIVVKPMIKKALKGEKVSEEVQEVQKKIHSSSQIGVINELILLFENKLVDLDDDGIRERLLDLNEYIVAVF